MIFGIICLFVGKWGIKKTQYCYKRYKENKYSDWDVGAVFSGTGVGIAFLVGIIVVMCQMFDVATCLTFPEKIILDELKLIYSSMNGGC